MKNIGFGRFLLKGISILCIFSCIIILVASIMALTNKLPELNNIVMNEVKDTELRAQLPENFPGLAFIITFAFALAETYLMWRAVADPKKTTFLIFYNLASLIVDGVFAVTQGVSGLIIVSIIWSAVTLIALLCARSEAYIVAETKAKTTPKAIATEKEDVKAGNK